jgi:hypothetical protein
MEQQSHDRLALATALDSRPERAPHEHQPQHEADEEVPLPEPADVGVFPALVAEPEIALEPEFLHHRQPLTGERTDHDDDQTDEQEVHAEALILRLVARYGGADVEARSKPCSGDPQHCELRMPGAGQ